ncbi:MULTISPECIES: DUF3606 domain-containing protein [Acidobacteriaceae]|uniref:DUF3606 domain-containing protein n=1 Tax=Acidobacteriaceae TaxID=204434 RepID=UPI00131C22A0|nr:MULTISPECIES: DUF3606 domain-containing protein [Acidobacteriaceae]MDW5266965.1 DUF3606 domain-containing protein [Edaphobacter sp.]
MADDNSNRGPADRARINIHEAYEDEYWSKELWVTPERLRELVGKHGVMAADIRKTLGK